MTQKIHQQKKISSFNNDAQYISQEQLNDKLEELVGKAPEDLNTLEEIANKLTNNDQTVTTISNALSGKANTEDVDNNNKIIVEAIAHLNAEIEVLQQMLLDKNIRINFTAHTIDAEEYTCIGEPMIIEDSGAPSVVPMFKGQRYYNIADTSNVKIYEAVKVTGSTGDWVLLN